MSYIKVDAAWCAVLRRLVPTIRHDILGSLSPLGMLCEVIHLRAQQPKYEPASLLADAAKMRGLYSAAMACTNQAMTWLDPNPSSAVEVTDGVSECIAMLQAESAVRGFEIESSIQKQDVKVSSSALRAVLTATILAIIDSETVPQIITLHCTRDDTQVALTLFRRMREQEQNFGAASPFRLIDWDDVAVLAAAESVDFEREGANVTLRFLSIEETPTSPPS